MKLDGSVALITGAGRGIGRAVAESLSAEGATSLLVARTRDELESVVQEIRGAGGKAHHFVADLTDEEEIAKVFQWVEREFGDLDILVNNAGIGRFAPVRDLRLSDFDAMWTLNLRSVFLLSQRAVRIMEKRKKGFIIQIDSLAGKNAFVGGAGYAATKWGLIGFSRCLMLEARQHNVRVVTICPGSVDTSFSSQAADPARAAKILAPEDVAHAVLAAISLPERALMSEIDLRPTNPK